MAENTNNTYIIDASFALCLLLPDENVEYVTKKFQEFQAGKIILINPPLFELEVINSLIIAHRRKRIDREVFDSLVKSFLRLRTITQSPNIQIVIETAEKYGLTSYDASYVALSQQLHIPLLTLDKKLKRIKA